MATKEAHSRANIEYNRRQDNIMIRPSKEMGAIIRQSAAAENMSVQGYVLQTLYARTGATGAGWLKSRDELPFLRTAELSYLPRPGKNLAGHSAGYRIEHRSGRTNCAFGDAGADYR